MSTLEREVIEKFHQLDKAAQRRVRELIVQVTEATGQGDASAFNYAAGSHREFAVSAQAGQEGRAAADRRALP